jgi:peroxidase
MDSGRVQPRVLPPLFSILCHLIEEFAMTIASICSANKRWKGIANWFHRDRLAKRKRNRHVLQRRLRTEWLESRQLLAADGLQHNFFSAEDVNDDGQCSPLDAMLIIGELNARAQASSVFKGQFFTDVNNDGQNSPADALLVINRLNHRDSNLPGPDRTIRSGAGGIIPSAPSEVRSFDGTGNNVNAPELGSTDEQLLRVAAANYGDGISSPAAADAPNPRTISNSLAAQSDETGPSDRDLSAFVYVWGQFIDHDISLTTSPSTGRETLNIAIPAGDAFFDADGSGDAVLSFTRSRFDGETGTDINNPRQQLNQITAWIDGSMVYGSSQATADGLRSKVGGKMLTGVGNLLPQNASGMFSAGDIRANENVELTALQTLFVREHNYWAEKIAASDSTLADEQIFQQARAFVIAEIQSITYNEWLPALLGRGAMERYTGYDAATNPSVSNEFSTAAFRLGHSLLQDDVEFIGNDGRPVRDAVELADAFFNPALLSESGIDSLLKYAASAQAAEIDTQIVDGVRNFLITGHGGMALDLAALNIQRGRDHGLADYNATRVAYGLAPVDSFDDITSNVQLQQALEAVYADVDSIDLWVGGLAEDHAPGSSVGELVQTIVADQFERLRDGDRFWYENVYSGRELHQLRNTHLADILQRNTTISNFQQDVFYMRSAVSGSVFKTFQPELGRRSGNATTAAAQVTVELLDDAGEVIDSTTTNVRGQYKFNSMAETGDYSIRVVANSGTRIVSPASIDFTLSRGDLRLHNLNFRLMAV